MGRFSRRFAVRECDGRGGRRLRDRKSRVRWVTMVLLTDPAGRPAERGLVTLSNRLESFSPCGGAVAHAAEDAGDRDRQSHGVVAARHQRRVG